MIKRLIEFVTGNRLLMVVLGVLVMGAGAVSMLALPVDAFPDVSPNLVQVFTETEGLAPEEVETYVTYPVETVMNGLPGVEMVRSVSNFGLSVVNVTFRDGMDIYFCRQLVNERLQEAREQIPAGLGDPAMGPISSVMGRVLYYYLEDDTGAYSLEDLRSMQDWIIKPQLQTLPGVTEVLGIGGFEKQYQVVIRPEALVQYDVTLSEVLEKIQANNLNTGAQFIEKNDEEYLVRSVGLATCVSDLEQIVIKAKEGTPVLLKQIADVRIGGAVRRGLQTRDGRGEVVAGQVIRLFGTNASTVIARVEEKLSTLNRMLPEGVRIVPYYEQKTLVQACVATVTWALVVGIGLVVLVLVVFLGNLRSSLVVALSLPFALLFALLGMKFFGLSANLMSFGGLAIAIGMIVDGAIVVVENVDRQFRMNRSGLSRGQLVVRGGTEVGQPILFAIGIIIVVFLPLFTLQGVEGKTFRPLAYTIALAMLGSLIYALLLSPVLASLLMRLPCETLARKKRSLGDTVLYGLERIYAPMVSLFVRWRVLAVGLLGVLLCVGGVVAPYLGSEFTPELQEGAMTLRLTLAPSIALEEGKRVTTRVEQRLMKIPEVAHVVSRMGRGEVGADTDPTNIAELYILLQPREQWRTARTQEELQQQIRDEVGEVPGALAAFSQPIAMELEELLEGVRAELAVKLFGDDLETLKHKADDIARILSTVSGAEDVQPVQMTGTQQVVIRIDRSAIARHGINVADVQQVVRAGLGGAVVGQVFEGVKRFDINVRFAANARNTIEAMGRVLIPAPNGTRIPLADLASIREQVGPRQITREQNQRFITVGCNVIGRDIGSFVQEAQTALAQGVTLPPGYFVTWGGEFQLQQAANRRLLMVIPVTLVIIVLLLFSSFNSLRNALLIFLIIPPALVGGILGLWLTGQHLSVPSSIGFIALFGIALENGMVLVTYMNQLVREGLSLEEASVLGACRRLRPVLMTAVTTALGLIPLLLSTGTGSEVQRPLAAVVIGGLVTATLLTLLVVPALYRWFAVSLEA
ncbi:MAG: CusA/CzcA family heavy metal efflux RND transporter [Phycisphaerae bacterium]|nr:CusA/CzcA family heavy metal efflux RND transporter [Phycisphaerae bacterium]